ncbi:small integral membrane protein 14 [Venturia canescens]|uniref:small integral membrane protein 14 n=1 Tax=Venturia canescens TaxID=32260 RepID=UPI001C9C742B|nr:small integral membrane protein 14 [Venturia canescens]
MDEGFDPCECVWSNLAVQRLLSILRQTQTACTENECYPTTRLPGPQNDQPSTDMFFLTMIFGVVALLYAFRPNTLRRMSIEDTKPFDNAPGSNDDPPVPPPAAN